MNWFTPNDLWLTRPVLQRGLALIYLVAFVNVLCQFRPLLGEQGLLPVPRFLRAVPFRRAPSIFHLSYSDRLLTAAGWLGVVCALAALTGVADRGDSPLYALPWVVMWVLYVSIDNVGQTFYGFGWEALLCEAGFLAIFLGPSATATPVLVVWLFRWIVFRLEFGAGLIKMRGDRCWRNLTCLDYHHETQPMPNPLSWHFHHLPRRVHRIEVLGNHFAQLVAPWGLLAPQPVAGIAGVVIAVTQGWLLLSGNFAWLNALTIVLAVSAFDSGWLQHVFPLPTPAIAPAASWEVVAVLAVTALVVVLSWWPVRNMLSRHQAMNMSFTPLHLVNTYGAFGSVTRHRDEVVVEGTRDETLGPTTVWNEYEFKGKPGDPRRRPRQFAPYHLRLDWLMWFAALSRGYAEEWLIRLLLRLLENDGPALSLLRRNPFPDEPPVHVRALLYRYRFSTRAERRATGAWWVRELRGEYLPPITLRNSVPRAAPSRPR